MFPSIRGAFPGILAAAETFVSASLKLRGPAARLEKGRSNIMSADMGLLMQPPSNSLGLSRAFYHIIKTRYCAGR